MTAEDMTDLLNRLTASTSSIKGIGPRRAAALDAIGVRTEGEFLTMNSARLGKALKLSVDKVLEMKDKLAATRNLDLRFR